MSVLRRHEHKTMRRRAKGRSKQPAGRPHDQDPVRLQRYLAMCGVASRRRSEELIRDGHVRIDGVVVTDFGVKVSPGAQTVTVKNKPVHPLPKGIILFHKPIHVVSTMSDPEGRPTVADYLTPQYRSYFPVGRLDWDSTGLMVFTNDGELAEHLLHPRFESEKVYQVEVQGRMPAGVLDRIERGITLEDGPIRAKVAIREDRDKSTLLELRIKEGRNRIIRRLMQHVNHPVIALTRTSMGPFRLGTLRPGQIRKLPEREYQNCRQIVLRVRSEKEG